MALWLSCRQRLGGDQQVMQFPFELVFWLKCHHQLKKISKIWSQYGSSIDEYQKIYIGPNTVMCSMSTLQATNSFSALYNAVLKADVLHKGKFASCRFWNQKESKVLGLATNRTLPQYHQSLCKDRSQTRFFAFHDLILSYFTPPLKTSSIPFIKY